MKLLTSFSALCAIPVILADELPGSVPLSTQMTINGVEDSPVITGKVKNNCPYSVWLQGDYCGGGTGQQQELRPGGEWYDPMRTFANGCSQTVKIAKYPGPMSKGHIYQVEWNIDANEKKVWYNLSGVDGDPFMDVARYLEVKGDACKVMMCYPGQRIANCEWPTMAGCEAHTGNDVSFYLC